MKKMLTSMLLLCTAVTVILQAQSNIPKGFSKGSVVLPGNAVLPGYIKDNMRSGAAVVFIAGGTEKKTNYMASELLAVQIDSTSFLCLQGDFFRVISDGELCFIQKASNASGKPVYNGTEAIFVKGTEGQINDYFFYDRPQQQLKLLTKKNRQEMVAGVFTNCAAAVAKAGETGSDLAQLRAAVDIYNHRKEK